MGGSGYGMVDGGCGDGRGAVGGGREFGYTIKDNPITKNSLRKRHADRKAHAIVKARNRKAAKSARRARRRSRA